jgi:hypothetical protein
MEQGLGMLFASGWTLDDVLGLTWGQLHVVSKCVVAYKAEQANLVLQAVSSALGGKVKRPAQSRAAEKPERTEAPSQAAGAKPVDVAARLAALGLPVDTV